MRVELDIAPLLRPGDAERLANTLGCQPTELAHRIQGIAQAALAEYLDMILGRHTPTRASEVRERRLLHLLKYYYRDTLPAEAQVCTLFQLTEAESRTLLRSVRAKYRQDVETELYETIQQTLSRAESKDGEWQVVIQSENVLEELRQVLNREGPSFQPIAKVRNSACVYAIAADTFDLLCRHYGIDLAKLEAAAGGRS